MRPIDADKLTDALWKMTNHRSKPVYDVLRAAIKTVEASPTIAPEDLRANGKWLRLTEPGGVL